MTKVTLMSADPLRILPGPWSQATVTVLTVPRVGEEVALGEDFFGIVDRVQHYIDFADPVDCEIYLYLKAI